MALYGASLVVMFARRGWALHLGGLAVGIPLAWYFLPPVAPAWRQAANSYYFLSQWEWYEWLGIVGPLVILMACGRWARERAPVLGRMAVALVRFGVFYFVVALLFCFVPRFAQLAALQPMRALQPIYLFLGFFAGGILVLRLGRHLAVLGMLFLGLCGGMYYAQLKEFPATPHVEWPGLPGLELANVETSSGAGCPGRPTWRRLAPDHRAHDQEQYWPGRDTQIGRAHVLTPVT